MRFLMTSSNNFKKIGFVVMKKAISDDIASFAYQYLLMKRQVAKTMKEANLIPPFETQHGIWTDKQVPDTYSIYGDVAMETLLLQCLDKMKETTGYDLIPTYAYARIYKKGDILHKHKDRESCEISTTLNLGGDPWPIYINQNPKSGYHDENKIYHSEEKPGTEVLLEPGDMLVYRGHDLEHWRNAFKGKDCGQVFLHYNDPNSKFKKTNLYDGRPHLGLPSSVKDYL